MHLHPETTDTTVVSLHTGAEYDIFQNGLRRSRHWRDTLTALKLEVKSVFIKPGTLSDENPHCLTMPNTQLERIAAGLSGIIGRYESPHDAAQASFGRTIGSLIMLHLENE